MKKALIFVSVFLLLFSYLTYIVIDGLHILKPVGHVNSEKCRLHPNIPPNFEGPEDMVKFDDMIIISATNHLKLYEVKSFGPEKVIGHLFALYPNETIAQIELEGYKGNLSNFRPFSINSFGNLLYVLNENYELGNDRMEVFELSKTSNGNLKVKFAYFLTFEDNFLGMFNNFIFLDKNEFLITTWMTIPDPPFGRSDSLNLWNNIKKYYNFFFKIQKTYVYYCIGEENKDAVCIQIKNTESVMNNGIAFDKPNKLVYVGKTLERKVTVYKYNEKAKPENSLNFSKDIELPCLPDNLNLDSNKQRIIIGCLGRTLDYIRLIRSANENEGKIPEEKEFWFGVASIEKDKAELLWMDDKMFRGAAGGVRRGETLYIGSFCENKLMMCEI